MRERVPHLPYPRVYRAQFPSSFLFTLIQPLKLSKKANMSIGSESLVTFESDDLKMNDFVFPIIGFFSFLAFVIFAIAIRVGRGPSPYRTMGRVHFLFGAIYFIGAFIWQKYHPEVHFTWIDWLAGFYVYFAFYYAFFAHVFATFMRGFSIEICVALYRQGGRGTHSLIAESYNGGKGIDFVKNERIDVLVESNALKQTSDRLSLMPFGEFAAKLNQVLLKIWNLRYLGLGIGDGR